MPLDDLKERTKAIDLAVGQIEKQFGKGSIMRLGQRNAIAPIEAISTGAISIESPFATQNSPSGSATMIASDPIRRWLLKTIFHLRPS